MAKEPNYAAMNDLIVTILTFCISSLQKEKEELKTSKEELDNNISKIRSRGFDVSDKLIEGAKAKKIAIVTINYDIKYIEAILNNIKTISSSTADEKNKYALIQNEVRPFFEQYNNPKSTNGNIVDILNGESHFKNIMNKTKIYGRYQGKIDELEKRVQTIIGKRNINVNPKKISDAPKESMLEKDLKYRIGVLRTKQNSMSNQQKIILISRQATISKRNAKVQKTEAKLKTAMKKGYGFRQWWYQKRLESLQKKKVFAAPAKAILFKERMIDFFTKISKYDENGNIDRRSWDKRRLDKIEKKTRRKL